MKISRKIVLLSTVIFLLAAACNKTQPQINNQPPPASPMAQPTSTNPSANSQAIKSAGQVGEVVFGSDLAEQPSDFISGQTALDLLKFKHKVVINTYSGIGEFVVSIDGMKPDSKHFWEFFVNGKSSNVGASSYVLKEGDKIEWKLSAISSSGQ